MARHNTKGTSYLGLDLHEHEEEKLQAVLKHEDSSAKKLIRKLLRNYLLTKELPVDSNELLPSQRTKPKKRK